MARIFQKIKKKKRIREDGVHNETIKVRRGTMKEEGDKTVSRLSSAATTVAERRMAVVRNDEYATASKEC